MVQMSLPTCVLPHDKVWRTISLLMSDWPWLCQAWFLQLDDLQFFKHAFFYVFCAQIFYNKYNLSLSVHWTNGLILSCLDLSIHMHHSHAVHDLVYHVKKQLALIFLPSSLKFSDSVTVLFLFCFLFLLGLFLSRGFETRSK